MALVCTVFILAAIILAQVLQGGGDGTRLIYCLPSYLLLGVAGVATLVTAVRQDRRLDRGCLVSVCGLSLYMFARIALSPVEFLASVEFFALLGALLVYFLTAYFVTGSGYRTAIVLVILLLGLVNVGVGVFQFGRDPTFQPFVATGKGASALRASGLFVSGNHLGGFLEVALILGVSLFLWGGFKTWFRMVIAYLALVCLAGVVLTGSRGSYLSAAVGIGVLAIMSVWTGRTISHHRLLPRLVAIGAAIALLLTALAIVSSSSFAIRQRASSVFLREDVRLQLWEAAWKQFQLAPFFGTGSRTYLIHGRTFRAPSLQSDPVFAHSDYLQTLGEYGITGLALALLLIFAHMRHAVQRWLRMQQRRAAASLRPDENKALALHLGCIGAIAAYLVHSALDFNLHIPANSLLMALVFGMLATRRVRSEEQPAGRWARLPQLIPAGMGVWMLAVGSPKVPAEFYVETARADLAAGYPLKVLKLANRAIHFGTRNPELYYTLGEARRLVSTRAGAPDAQLSLLVAAHKAYSQGLALFPQDVRLLLMTGWTLDKTGRSEEADALFAKAAELDPNSGIVWTFQALHAKLQGKPAEALAHYRKTFNFYGGPRLDQMTLLGERLDGQEMEKAAAQPGPEPK
jgi:O-antigen ligase